MTETTVISRRKAFGALAATGAAVASSSGPAAAQGAGATVTLLLVNDIYKMSEDKGRGGFARLSGIVKEERAKGTPMLYFHAGDCFSPSLMSGFDQGEHIVELTNFAAPDVFVPGNHEFDFGKDIYFKRHAQSKFPYFAANMRQADGSPIPGHKDNEIFERGGFKIGVFGVALPYTAQLSSPGDIKFLPTMDTVRAQAKLLRDAGADIVVCCAHTDREEDNAIVRSRLVDILLTGHDHDLAVAFDGRAVMVESNEEGNYVTAIDLAISARNSSDGRRTVSWSPSFRINDSKNATPDPETLAAVKKYEAELSKELDVDIGTTAVPLDSTTISVRTRETAIGNLFADAIKASTGADVAIVNGGGIRANKQYPPGQKLSRRDILTELPFGNVTVMVELSGADLKAALENGVSLYEQRAGRFAQVSGMTYEFDPKLPVGQRVTAVTVAGQPLDPAKTYKVAANEFILAGGDGYTSLGKGKVLIGLTDGKLMANEVMVYVRKLGEVTSKVEGRIAIK
ncbi:MAG: bifunctional metallophosphatase/5'-nucleotidase [Rhizobiales bacterium 65-9]|nr:bifunctional metallophosphatase/5'-nucleotidase [Hyphomicrobiales bacterium]OJY32955.1 MAG: bifunctional metallophosphatase/5'-nucleotidase [Rhizobiales bacterium 65-9]